jgi:uncharacterized membrane protein
MSIDPEFKKICDDVAEIKAAVKKIKNHFIREEILSWLKIILLLVPFIIVTIYLMPIIQKMLVQYQNLFNLSSNIVSGDMQPEDVSEYLTPEILRKLENLQN